ncbi:hypothetical protein QVD17_26335 [Tagetes erecta]|uniref:Uncharacterized protein n=1 Tax=Tagetes erecta TaxID=13708 RepID=A0AAD8NQQ3_TARER|nr:hypothetical protein QVD17_26335 [Tagetes erecta]
MASLNPSFSPNYGVKPWVDQINTTLKTQIAITIDPPPVSIFEVPLSLKAENDEAYVPQRVGLGPYHHFHPELYHKMEQKKLSTIKKALKPHQIHDFEKEIVQKVKNIVPLIRNCYASYHDADDDTLAWLLAIDGMLLIDQLDAYSNPAFTSFHIEATDLIMLENQIPLIVLNEIHKALLGKNAHDQQHYLETKFRSFCKSHSSFVLMNENADFSGVNHMLDYMYNSVVNNEKSIPKKVDFINYESDEYEAEVKQDLLEAVIRFAGVIPGAEPFYQIIEFLMRKVFEIVEENTQAEEINVPTVSELCKIASVDFRLSPNNEGIRNISFVQGKARYCYLPVITLNADSEVVLRNLVAYEKLMAKNSLTGGYGLELTEYVDFMCGIIDSVKDVKLLREQKIIQGDLSDEEVVKIFNGIGKSRVTMSVESELKKTVGQLNMVYESMPRVWVPRMIQKRFMASARFLTIVICVSGLLIFIREVYMTVYGLDSFHRKLAHFLRTKLRSLLLFLAGPKGPNEIA